MKTESLPGIRQVGDKSGPHTIEPVKSPRSANAIRWVVIGIGILVMCAKAVWG